MSAGTWIPQIDGLRFIAITSVILFHIMGQLTARSGRVVVIQPRYLLLTRLIGNGDRGVLLFFVISGYILARPFFREHRGSGKHVALQAYYLRRLTRLEPPYILSLLCFVIAFLSVGAPLRPMLPHLAASMFYFHGLIYRQDSTINFVTWSLEIEVQFYLLAPLLGLLYKIPRTALRRSVLAALILIGGGFHLFAATAANSLWKWTLLNYSQYFFAGFLLADVIGDLTPHRNNKRWDAVSFAGWPVVFLLPRVEATIAWLPLLIVPLYLAAFYGPISNRFFSKGWVALTGGMCYSLYLMHMLVVSVLFRATHHLVFHDFLLSYALQVALLGGGVMLFGMLFYIMVERPCMDPQWPQKLWQKISDAKAHNGRSA